MLPERHIIMKKIILLLAICFQAACVSAPKNPEYISVYKSDGSRQCESGGVSLETMQHELLGIKVYSAQKDTLRGVSFPSVCGGMTGNVNVYMIAPHDLPKAKQLGFTPFVDGL